MPSDAEAVGEAVSAGAAAASGATARALVIRRDDRLLRRFTATSRVLILGPDDRPAAER
jgi:hypothetical protein